MEAFVLKTLRRIKKEAPRRFKDLRSICDDLIGKLSAYYRYITQLNYTEALTENQKVGGSDNDADKYFDPLQAACETRQPRLMEIALDAIHFLIGN